MKKTPVLHSPATSTASDFILTKRRSPIAIAGMHRSGTSLIARLLNRCGVDLGSEKDLAGPAPDNPDGFFENRKFVAINERVLELCGGGWDYPQPLPPDWRRDEEFQKTRSDAADLAATFRGDDAWGWKDPRTSLTIEFWQDLFPNLRAVVCLRNPLEVALSLRRRNNFSVEHGLALWARYTSCVMEKTDPAGRVVTRYDAYFDDPEEELRRLLGLLQIQFSRESIDHALVGFKPGFRHGVFTFAQLAEAGASQEVLSLYDSMMRDAGSESTGIAIGRDSQRSTGQIARDLVEQEVLRQKERRPRRAEIRDEVRRILTASGERRVEDQFASVVRLLQRMQAELDETERGIAEANGRADAAVAELEKMHADATARLKEAAETGQRYRAEIDRLHQELARRAAAAAALERTLRADIERVSDDAVQTEATLRAEIERVSAAAMLTEATLRAETDRISDAATQSEVTLRTEVERYMAESVSRAEEVSLLSAEIRRLRDSGNELRKEIERLQALNHAMSSSKGWRALQAARKILGREW